MHECMHSVRLRRMSGIFLALEEGFPTLRLGRLEHLLFGRSNDEIIRTMHCSMFLIKEEPGGVLMKIAFTLPWVWHEFRSIY